VERISIYKGSSSNQRLPLWRNVLSPRKVLLYAFIKGDHYVGRRWVTTTSLWIRTPHTQKFSFELLTGGALTTPYPQK
jgi:hypothetical protein